MKVLKNATIFLSCGAVCLLGCSSVLSSHDVQAFEHCSQHVIERELDKGTELKSEYVVNRENLLPSYYFENNYLTDKLRIIKGNSAFENGVSFIFITDLHILDNSLSSKELVKLVLDKTSVDFVVSGGDIPAAYAKASNSAEDDCYYQANVWREWVEYWGKENVYQLKGNHDYVVDYEENDSFFRFSEEETYNRIMSFVENKVCIGQQGFEYYYFDIKEKNIRFVVLDAHIYHSNYLRVVPNYFSSEQADWLLNVLDDSNGYNVVLLSHEPCDDALTSYSDNMAILHSIATAFKNKIVFKGDYSGRYFQHDFKHSTGDLVCIISGHSHKDESNFKDNVLSISTTSDAMYNKDGYCRELGTINESAFDIYSIDVINKSIKTTRVGFGDNRAWLYS